MRIGLHICQDVLAYMHGFTYMHTNECNIAYTQRFAYEITIFHARMLTFSKVASIGCPRWLAREPNVAIGGCRP